MIWTPETAEKQARWSSGLVVRQLRAPGSFERDFRNASVSRATRTRENASSFVLEDTGELVGNVRAAVVTLWHGAFLDGEPSDE